MLCSGHGDAFAACMKHLLLFLLGVGLAWPSWELGFVQVLTRLFDIRSCVKWLMQHTHAGVCACAACALPVRAGELINVLREAKQKVPEALLAFGTTVKKKEHKL